MIEGQQRGASLSNSVASEIRKNGVARPTYAYSQIVLPQTLAASVDTRDVGAEGHKFLTYRNDSFSVPGISVATTEVRRYGYGPTEKKPYGINYQDVTFNYILDASSNQHKFFYNWIDAIVNHSDPAEYGHHGGQQHRAARPYEVKYKEDYAAQIIIRYFDESFDKGATPTIAQLVDAYPTFIGDIQYNWANTDQLIRLPITYTYKSWYIKDVNIGAELNSNPGGNESNIFGQILKAGSAIQALSTLRSPRNISDVLNIVNTTNKIF
jgi:hypothetical protein